MTMTDTAPPTLSLAMITACDIATGATPADPGAGAISVRAADRDLNARGNGSEWHRMVWRGGAWVYFGVGRLPSGRRLAHERCASVDGDVYEGEIVVRHDRGGPVDAAYLVLDVPRKSGARGSLHSLEIVRSRDGLRLILPTGAQLTLPDPRRR